MSNKIVFPVKIRPHLIPFLFKELEGKDSEYMGKKNKAIVIYPFSIIGKFLNYQLESGNKEGKKNPYTIYLSIEKKTITTYDGTIYISENGTYFQLFLTEDQIQELNNLLEDIFRISFIYYMDGFLKYNKNINPISAAINDFIEEYNLLEVGFSYDTLRKLYYREKKKDKKLTRLQHHSGNRVLNY